METKQIIEKLTCHSEVDDRHKKRLCTGANRIILEDFNEKYPSFNKDSLEDNDLAF